MVIQTLSKIEDWDNSRCSTSGLTSCKKQYNLIFDISLRHGFPGTVTTWMMWFPNNSMIQNQHLWSQDAFQIPLRNTTSREIIFLSNGLRSKGQDIMAGFGPVKMYRFINSSYLSPQKRQNILISWYRWVVSMHTSRLQGHVWQWLWLRCSLSDRPTSLGKYKKRHWLKQLSSLKSKWKFRLKPNHQFHHWDSATILQVWMMPPPWIFSACLPGLSPSVTHGQVQRCSSCVLQNP